jgi:hypothetical protein
MEHAMDRPETGRRECGRPVGDDELEGIVAGLWEESRSRGGHRPTIKQVRDRVREGGRGVGTLRIDLAIRALEEAGSLPDLPMTGQQRGGSAAKAATSAASDELRAEHAREAEAIRRARADRPRGAGGPDHRRAVREHLAAERRIGIRIGKGA